MHTQPKIRLALRPIAWALMSAGCMSSQAQNLETEYPPVQVKDTPLAYRQLDKVESTGSSIIRKEHTQTLPMQVITRADIQNSGKHDIAELIQSLPAMSGFTSPVDVGMENGGSNGAAIHGLQNGTVVLINGRRVAPWGRQYIAGANNNGSELSLLPLSAIERIEIVTDGSSTIYGTDAIAGVLNIITRSERPGIELTAEHRIPDGGKAQGSRADLSIGKGRLLRDGYSWFMAADLQQQNPLNGTARPYAAQGRYAVQQDGKNYWAYDPQLSLAQTSPTLSGNPTNAASKIWSASYQNGACSPSNAPVYGQNACYYSPLMQTDLSPKVEAARIHAQGQLVLDADNLVFAEFGLQSNTQKRLTRTWAPYTAQIANTPGAPGYDLALANGLDPAKGVWLNYSGSDLGLAARRIDMQTVRLTTGLKGQWQNWDYRSALYYSSSRVQYGSDRFTAYPDLGVDAQGFLTNSALLAPLSSSTPASQTLRSQLQSMRYWNSTDSGSTSLTGLELHLSRAVGEFKGREILLAAGSDIRLENDRYETFMPSITQPAFQGKRTVWAQFAELQLPVLANVEAVASLRNDHYSDFGNTTHVKLSAKWSPAEEWLLRGAMGTGFRAPAIAQMQATGIANGGAYAISTCTAALQAVADKLGGTCPKDNNYWLYSQGNPDLKPEQSRHINLGIRFAPSRDQSFSIDYWNLDIRDKLNQLSQTTILNQPLEHLQFFELNDQKELQIHTSMVNTGRTQKSGIDFGWSMRQPSEWGQFHARIGGTWLLTSRYKDTADSAWINDLNTLSKFDGYVVPRLRMQMTAGLNQSNWQALATVNYMHSYDDGGFSGINAATGESVQVDHHRVPSYWTMDLSMRYEIDRKWRVRAGMENIFNRQSPLSFGTQVPWNFGTNPMYASLWGRTLNLSTTYQF